MEADKEENGKSGTVINADDGKEVIIKDCLKENEKLLSQENVDENKSSEEMDNNLKNQDEGKDGETEVATEEVYEFIIDKNEDEKSENENIEEDKKKDENTFNEINVNKSGNETLSFEKSLVADYRSASESESCDSESDSTSEESESEAESESDSDSDSGSTDQLKKPKKEKKVNDLTYADLPPIEDLKISVPEEQCEEIGTITSIVDTLVVVESYKGTAPLDIDSILFLDKGKRTLGKIFDVIGPVSEPVYTVRFTNVDQIKRNEIEKGLKVFSAPKTEHSSYVFLPDLLKMKGSDASWKDNMEPPPECQDFSDDEEEQRCRGNYRSARNENNRRRNQDQNPLDPTKKSKAWNNHSNARPPGKYINPSRFQNAQHFPRPVNNFTASSSWSYQQQINPAQPAQSSPSFTQFQPNPFSRPTNPMYATAPPFGTFRFPNVPPFPSGNFIFNAAPPPPPPVSAVSTVQNPIISYPTRTTGPPPFSSFVTPAAGNRMPVQPFPFNAGFAQHPNFYPQQMQFNNNNAPGVPNTQRLPATMARTFGSDIRGPPPPPPPV